MNKVLKKKFVGGGTGFPGDFCDDDEYDNAGDDCDVELVVRKSLLNQSADESPELERQQAHTNQAEPGDDADYAEQAAQDSYCWDSERGLVKADSDSDS